MEKKHTPAQQEYKPVEFSKLIVILGILMWLAVNIFGMVMMAITRNLQPMVYIIASVDAVMACLTGWYSWKAKAENVIKLKSMYGIDITEMVISDAESKKKSSKHKYEIDDCEDLGDSGPMFEDTSIV